MVIVQELLYPAEIPFQRVVGIRDIELPVFPVAKERIGQVGTKASIGGTESPVGVPPVTPVSRIGPLFKETVPLPLPGLN